MKNLKKKKYLIAIFLVCIVDLNAQSITGLTGLVSIPTAEVISDGKLTIGASFYNKNYLNIYDTHYNGLGTYITFGFLPFVEVSFRTTRLLNYTPGTQSLGDRMASIRIRLIEEGKILPSFLFGAHDFLRSTDALTSYNNSTYFAATKNFSLSGNNLILKIDLGYGLQLQNSREYQFDGLFYGVSFNIYKTIELMVENDTKRFNSGVRVNLFDRISCTAGLMNIRYFSGTVSYSLVL